jgi:hypothetical protein
MGGGLWRSNAEEHQLVLKELTMRNRRMRSLPARLGISAVATLLVGLVVGTASAHTGTPSAITVTPTGGHSVSASGTWQWSAVAKASTPSYVGFAIDWGDITSGNAVGTYHIGDGTTATNIVMQPTTPATGSAGTFGPVSHTYALAGKYTVCVIIYDLGTTKPFATTGYHSTQAGGTNHNTDNSVDHHQQTPSFCGVVTIVDPSQSVPVVTASPTAVVTSSPVGVPSSSPVASAVVTPTPFQSFEGETSGPGITPPPTSTSDPQQPQQGLPLLLVMLMLGTFGFVFALQSAGARR